MTYRYRTLPLILALVASCGCAPAEPPPSVGPSIDHATRHQAVIAREKQRVASAGDTVSSQRLISLGDAQLRGGKCAEAVKSFEAALAKDPSAEPHLWQYGIALFFVDRFEEGKQLFEKHRQVNPNDVENAAWHFLCASKADGLDKAREILLPAPNDTRPPMKQVLARLPGGDSKAIEFRINQMRGTPTGDSAAMYGYLYLGLIADAEGDAEAARRWMDRAAATPLTYYMPDIARVYAKHLSDQSDTFRQPSSTIDDTATE
ncbi:MAG: tetratricopeptide repeat protein [Planctomycetota bacterium]